MVLVFLRIFTSCLNFGHYRNVFFTLGLDLKVTGNTGHGSRFIEKTAAEKLVILGNPLDYFRNFNTEIKCYILKSNA